MIRATKARLNQCGRNFNSGSSQNVMEADDWFIVNKVGGARQAALGVKG